MNKNELKNIDDDNLISIKVDKQTEINVKKSLENNIARVFLYPNEIRRKQMKMTLKGARVNAGITVVKVAGLIGVNKATVYNWESGLTEPKAGQIALLVELYGIRPDNLKLKKEIENGEHL